MFRRTLVIANPQSAGGATGRRWRQVESALHATLGKLEVELTRAPRDAERLAREAVRAGYERIVVAGGDGTLSEVATGLLSAGLAHHAEIGILPLGSGGDLARTLGIPRSLPDALALLRDGKARRIDAGLARYSDSTGAERSSHFLNAASAGVSGLVMRFVNQSHKRLGSRATFLLSSLRAILAYEAQAVRLRVDGELVHEGRLILAAASNGRYFGGGMQPAPDARVDDALFDVLLLSDMSRVKLLVHLETLYRGAHLSLRGVLSLRGRVVELEPAERAPDLAGARASPVPIELDGEPLGTLPACFEILPGAISVVATAP